MCDTIAIVDDGRVWFAKNSDRDANEAQGLEWHPRQRYGPDETLLCTWITIPQARETRAVLISRPYWMWGAEMGANEDGVVIGNEAVFTREPYAATGLTGMDLVRLGLERGKTAGEARDVILQLLEIHGQGGGCGHEHRNFTYHNSFLILDPTGGFVLETAGRHWATEPVAGVRTISNGLTIPGFAEKYSDRLKTHVSGCRQRRPRTEILGGHCRVLTDMFALLRDHGAGNPYPGYHWSHGGLAAPCVHGGGLAAAAQTTASWVSELRPDGFRHWVTATAAPCTSIFKPVSVECPLELGPFPRGRADASFWWRHERFHRTALRDPAACFPAFDEARNALERAWTLSPPEPDEAFAEHDRLLEKWTATAKECVIKDARPWYVRRYWRKRNRRAGMMEP